MPGSGAIAKSVIPALIISLADRAGRLYLNGMTIQEPQSAYAQLKPVERAFVDAYLSELKGSARKAGQKIIDFVKSTSATHFEMVPFHSNELMNRPLVKAAIAERTAELCRAMEIDAYTTLREVKSIAVASMADYIDIVEGPSGGLSGRPRSDDIAFRFQRCTPEQMAAIESLEVSYDEYGSPKIKLKLHSKLKALDMLMKFQGLYDLDNAQRAGVDGSKAKPAAQLSKSTTVEQAGDLYAQTLRAD